MTCKHLACIAGCSLKIIRILEKWIAPAVLLAIRFFVAKIFFLSGRTKIATWDSTIFLFKNEYHVPVISPELAAYLSTAVELSAPVLLVIGLGSRIAASALLFMTFVIEFTYMHFDVHEYWALLILVLISVGPGKFALDTLIRRKYEAATPKL